MYRPDLGSATDRWAVFRFAAVSSGAYVAWLIAFERWVEPLLRRLLGAIFSCQIVWLHFGGWFRIWGIDDAGRTAKDAAFALVGSLVVLSSAVIPVAALHVAARLLEPDREEIRATVYLMSAPLMIVFVLRVLRRDAK